MNANHPAVIQPLRQASVRAAAWLLAAGMRDNPLHRRVFGNDDARLEPLLADAFVRLLHRQMRSGCVLGAYEGDVLVGVAAMVPPGQCQPSLEACDAADPRPRAGVAAPAADPPVAGHRRPCQSDALR